MLFLNPTLSYCSLVWIQNFRTIKRIVNLQKKAVRIINFQPRNFHTSRLFKQSSMCVEKISLVSISVTVAPSVFNTWFSFSSEQHIDKTSSSRQGNLIKSSYRTNSYGKYSVIGKAVDFWNKIKKNPLKTNYWKIYPTITLKHFAAIFILNHINNFYSSWDYIRSFS